MTTGKTIALTRWTFAGKVRSLLLNMLSRFYRAQEESLKKELSWKRATLYQAKIQTLLETI